MLSVRYILRTMCKNIFGSRKRSMTVYGGTTSSLGFSVLRSVDEQYILPGIDSYYHVPGAIRGSYIRVKTANYPDTARG